MTFLEENETAQGQTEAASKKNHSDHSRFGETLTSKMEDLIDHVLELSWRLLVEDEPMTRDEAEAIVAEILHDRCFYFGETRTDEFIGDAWTRVRKGAA